MFTLLPEQYKKKLWKLYRLRLATVIFLFISAIFLISIGLLFPSYISLAFDKGILHSETEALEAEIKSKNDKGLSETLNRTNTILALVKPDNTYILESVEAILKQKPVGVSISTISYTRGQDQSSINISGTAKERNDLIIFTKQLQKESGFTSVTLPVSNLAKQVDVPFSLEILGKF
jgi:Tfp pilus assembly protein PilN